MNLTTKIILLLIFFYALSWPWLPFLLEPQIKWIKKQRQIKRNWRCVVFGHIPIKTEYGFGGIDSFIYKCERCGKWL